MKMARQVMVQHADRLIASGRIALADLAILAVWLDPAQPAHFAAITYGLLFGYLVYAVFLGAVAWRQHAPDKVWDFLTHAVDLAVFAYVMYLTGGDASPFFVLFVFSLLCAALRWQWRGTLWTAVAALAAFVVAGVAAGNTMSGIRFGMMHAIVPGAYLTITAVMLGYGGVYYMRAQHDMARLAAWPRYASYGPDLPMRDLLDYVAGVMRAPRVLMAWRQPDDPPSLTFTMWSNGQLQEPQGRSSEDGALVARPLDDFGFLCANAAARNPLVLFGNPDAVHRWRGAPLRAEFRARFAIKPVLSLPVPSESVEGRLFILDRQGMTSDDLMIGHVVADHVATCLDQFDLLRRLEETVARGERSRVARDLHDGVLQTLAGTAMQLQEVHQLLARNPQAAQERLEQIQRGIEEEQRQLRIFIMRLKPPAVPPRQVEIGLSRLLEQLAIRLRQQWGLEVRWKVVRPQERISTVLWHELSQIICEGAANAKRHGRASYVDIAVDVQDSQVCLSIANDGRSFPFRGHLDLAALAKRNLGPTTLRERIMALGGDLAVDSRTGGARLEIRLPLLMEGVANAN